MGFQLYLISSVFFLFSIKTFKNLQLFLLLWDFPNFFIQFEDFKFNQKPIGKIFLFNFGADFSIFHWQAQYTSENAINLLSQRAYEIQIFSSDQTQKHSFQLPLPKAFLLRKLHFSHDLIYWNEIPDIRQKVMGSIIKYWNHIRTFAFVIFGPNSSNNSDLCLLWESTQYFACFCTDITNFMTTRGSSCRYANFLSCGILCKYLHNISLLNLIRTKFSFHKTNFGLNKEKQFINHINNFKKFGTSCKNLREVV